MGVDRALNPLLGSETIYMYVQGYIAVVASYSSAPGQMELLP